jgi:geranylgeranylglycerol-phosphate geranylgeranyltransferase
MVSIMNGINLKKIWYFIRLLRPEISFLSIICVYIGAIVSLSDYYSTDLILGMLAIFFIAAGCHPVNDYFDYEIDKVNHPNRPLPAGIFKPINSLYFGIFFFMISLVLSYLINILCFSIVVIGIFLIFSYELSLKNKVLIGNIVVAFTVALSFIYGGAIVNNPVKPIFFTLIAFFIFLGREIIMDIRDFKGDQKKRVTLPLKIGMKSALYIANSVIIFSMVLLFLPFFLNMFTSILYVFLAMFIVLITAYGIILSLLDVKNAGKTSEILRISMVMGLILFLIARFL